MPEAQLKKDLVEILVTTLEDINTLEALLNMAHRKKKLLEARIVKTWKDENPPK